MARNAALIAHSWDTATGPQNTPRRTTPPTPCPPPLPAL